MTQNSPRILIPKAVVAALSALIEGLPDLPSAERVELRTIRSQLCRLYRIADPQGRVPQVQQAWDEAPDEELP